MPSCRSCNTELPEGDFYRNASCKAGIDSKCKLCRLEYHKQARLKRDPSRATRIEHRALQASLKTTGTRLCGRCSVVKPLSEFYQNPSEDCVGACRGCWNTRRRGYKAPAGYAKKYRCTSSGIAAKLFTEAKVRTREKSFEENCDLDTQSIKAVIDQGMCQATGLPFVLDPGSPWRPSIDRTDSSIGYCKSNTKVVVALYNYAKNRYSEDELLKLAKAIVERAEG